MVRRSFIATYPRYHYSVGLFAKKKAVVSGVSILVLQKRLQRYSSHDLNEAMQRAWRRDYHPQTFFATSIFDGDGALLKVNDLFVFMRHFDRRLERKEVAESAIPEWANHTSYTSVEYKCPGGVPEGEVREKMYGFLGLLCGQLCSEGTTAIFFIEERIFIRNTDALRERLSSGVALKSRKTGAGTSKIILLVAIDGDNGRYHSLSRNRITSGKRISRHLT